MTTDDTNTASSENEVQVPSVAVNVEQIENNQTTVVELGDNIDIENSRFPFCLVWTPTPILSWILPFFGHIGIATSTGIIRDFPFPYRVRENNMAFGKPTKYVQLKQDQAFNGDAGWDAAVTEASHMYKKKMHFLLFQNCHSHVSKAMNLMQYGGCTTWNQFKLIKLTMTQGKYVNRLGIVKTWLPFAIFILIIVIIITTCTDYQNST